MEVAALAFLASIALAFLLLARQRARTRPEDDSPAIVQRPPRRRQERIMAKLEPLPEIPTVMDLVRQEVEETGVENIPGHEGLSGPVMLKVFKRDQAVIERCTHGSFGYVVRDGVSPADANDDDVTLFCDQCGEVAETEPAAPEEDAETNVDQ